MNITQSIIAEYAHVYSGDEALDLDGDGDTPETQTDSRAAKIESYQRALETGDPTAMPLKRGQKPGVFWLRNPDDELRRYVVDEVHGLRSRPMAASRRAVALLLVRVDNVTVDGKPFEIKSEPGVDGWPEVTKACLNVIGQVDKGELIKELAARTYKELAPSKN